MKILSKILFVGIVSLFSLTIVNASEADLADPNNKTLINVDGRNVYISAHIDTNMKDPINREKEIIRGVTGYYDSLTQTFYVSVKRSEINKVFEKKYENVYEWAEVNIDYHDIKPNTDYYYFQQQNSSGVQSPAGVGYSFYNAKSDYLFRNYNYIELISTSLPLSGGNDGSYRYSYGGGKVVFEGTPSSDFVESNLYDKTQFDLVTATKLFDFPQTRVKTSIIEDVQIDLGENDKIVSSDSTDVKQVEKNINNFYAEYFENNKLKYSWTMYDENGKPVIVNVNTAITLDNSENEDKILALFDTNESLKDRIMVVTFDQHGEINGKAKISLYVGDKFAPGSRLNLFYFNPDDIQLEALYYNADGTAKVVTEEEPAQGVTDEPGRGATEENNDIFLLVDADGYITFELTHFSEYVLASAEVTPVSVVTEASSSKEVAAKAKKTSLWGTIKENKYEVIGSAVALTGIIVLVIVKIKKKKQ